jgi:hypothetical protein
MNTAAYHLQGEYDIQEKKTNIFGFTAVVVRLCTDVVSSGNAMWLRAKFDKNTYRVCISPQWSRLCMCMTILLVSLTMQGQYAETSKHQQGNHRDSHQLPKNSKHEDRYIMRKVWLHTFSSTLLK